MVQYLEDGKTEMQPVGDSNLRKRRRNSEDEKELNDGKNTDCEQDGGPQINLSNQNGQVKGPFSIEFLNRDKNKKDLIIMNNESNCDPISLQDFNKIQKQQSNIS